ncbi:MAG: L-asparaginase, thermolabile family protein [Rhizobacter sp.]|nr:L-asparaginase, thermolabile family protein [Rhizobacter sp.]
MNHNPTLVEVLRGTAVESTHAGALAIVDAYGRLVASIGDIERPIFPRSAVKLLQALPLVESGAADRLGLSDEELALACASHNGEERHVAAAASMLAKAGVDVAVLECGTHWPYEDGASRRIAAAGALPNALNNNCSGKHSGFICLACVLMDRESADAETDLPGDAHGSGSGSDRLRHFCAGYVKPDHPVMREVSSAIAGATRCDLSHAPAGTDGCSIPTFALPLRSLAAAYARMGSGIGLSSGRAHAAARLRKAVAAHPFMVAGTGRFDTKVMERLGERVYLKVGAEGVFCASFPAEGYGVALKIDDGHTRAAEVAMARIVEHVLRLDDAHAVFMHTLSEPVMRNWNGILVGSLRPAGAWRHALLPG